MTAVALDDHVSRDGLDVIWSEPAGRRDRGGSRFAVTTPFTIGRDRARRSGWPSSRRRAERQSLAQESHGVEGHHTVRTSAFSDDVDTAREHLQGLG
ncbi:hypothetical protein O2W15_10990 [Modestobacter sp. VKM Ac-2979]|uniref:hypothetical protein n=1 Tax=unclassified Modestobacter TaxID=2643866 RepID=UPI0022AB8416|nr:MULTISPECIES: hypothetical protein [unclassified Modestobacter]MCZ2811961.1 hypothetical protein [Modestobacter sp. VKM Ac-2979]MCZ2843685.1 hypothetical protein [Modestobacter sp. VKM Ac-2980]